MIIKIRIINNYFEVVRMAKRALSEKIIIESVLPKVVTKNFSDLFSLQIISLLKFFCPSKVSYFLPRASCAT